ncbi:hypothetical protein I302_100836 [Kwoniella bestiolae CBS 10118]|uniref:Uncharacterized protein n=1 Tax=Kwoniella bestiolae CBS 10118 TaxID=1296100 RepID=A0AAJ8K142_9TREE
MDGGRRMDGKWTEMSGMEWTTEWNGMDGRTEMEWSPSGRREGNETEWKDRKWTGWMEWMDGWKWRKWSGRRKWMAGWKWNEWMEWTDLKPKTDPLMGVPCGWLEADEETEDNMAFSDLIDSAFPKPTFFFGVNESDISGGAVDMDIDGLSGGLWICVRVVVDVSRLITVELE